MGQLELLPKPVREHGSVPGGKLGTATAGMPGMLALLGMPVTWFCRPSGGSVIWMDHLIALGGFCKRCGAQVLPPLGQGLCWAKLEEGVL